MAIKAPTPKQISSLVGGKPLASKFDPETGSLVVIAPTGQKLRFTQQDWTKSAGSDPEEGEASAPPAKQTPRKKKST